MSDGDVFTDNINIYLVRDDFAKPVFFPHFKIIRIRFRRVMFLGRFISNFVDTLITKYIQQCLIHIQCFVFDIGDTNPQRRIID